LVESERWSEKGRQGWWVLSESLFEEVVGVVVAGYWHWDLRKETLEVEEQKVRLVEELEDYHLHHLHHLWEAVIWTTETLEAPPYCSH